MMGQLWLFYDASCKKAEPCPAQKGNSGRKEETPFLRVQVPQQ